MLSDSNRTNATDKKFEADLSDSKFVNYLFVRLVAKKKRLTKIDFKYTIFDGCYLRDCSFDSCDFTGCRFISTNFHGSKFAGCTFDYAIFEKTLVDSEILENGCPAVENLKMKFARTLRMNYQQLGDAESVNKAIRVELAATEAHLHKAWHANESYYRNKYQGADRVKMYFRWLGFKTLDLAWGNGESVPRLARTTLFAFLLMAVVDVFFFGKPTLMGNYWDATIQAPQIFFGIVSPAHYAKSYLTLILFVRLVFLGSLMSIILKRYNRR